MMGTKSGTIDFNAALVVLGSRGAWLWSIRPFCRDFSPRLRFGGPSKQSASHISGGSKKSSERTCWGSTDAVAQRRDWWLNSRTSWKTRSNWPISRFFSSRSALDPGCNAGAFWIPPEVVYTRVCFHISHFVGFACLELVMLVLGEEKEKAGCWFQQRGHMVWLKKWVASYWVSM